MSYLCGFFKLLIDWIGLDFGKSTDEFYLTLIYHKNHICIFEVLYGICHDDSGLVLKVAANTVFHDLVSNVHVKGT